MALAAQIQWKAEGKNKHFIEWRFTYFIAKHRSNGDIIRISFLFWAFQRSAQPISHFPWAISHELWVQINSTIDQQSIPPFVFLSNKNDLPHFNVSFSLFIFLRFRWRVTIHKWMHNRQSNQDIEINILYWCLMCSTLVFYKIFLIHLTSNRIIYATILVIIIQNWSPTVIDQNLNAIIMWTICDFTNETCYKC